MYWQTDFLSSLNPLSPDYDKYLLFHYQLNIIKQMSNENNENNRQS